MASATLAFGGNALAPGQVHGERYRIRSLLGQGGMGEVWRAYDLKLHLDVALKCLRPELIEDPQALEMLRQEVRSAREVVSPNVCRVFDLEQIDDQEWISMEYVDGDSLMEILVERGPLALDEAREIASQFLAGLEAIHDTGLIHRDVKPENIMVTRTGRVVVMDFGIAKSLEEGMDGEIAGTPAYMAPEQVAGKGLDARADVFAAGVVLAEMVAPEGVRSLDSRRRLWKGIRATKQKIPESPWSKVIGRAVAAHPEQRFDSARVLARALEEVTLRAAGDEDARPYPGLAAFTEGDAGYFFGRELEIEGLWKKLRRPRLSALIAPSGAGKSSFLRAGLMATLPQGWRAILVTPGRQPFRNLARELLSELDEDAANTGPPSFENPEVAIARVASWQRRHEHVLIIVDQFEELFTQTPEELRAGFVELISRLPLTADAHVLLAMREDFLFNCQPFERLTPMLSGLTMLGALGGSSLRRAVVQPALKCGYRFEDEALVDEILAEVSSERGALPLLAFAAAQLWDRRDRETGLITREAYAEIGGVGGALAQHAEATLEAVGEDRVPIVRELFRNLATAQGTRAARTREELLSVFGGARAGNDREDAELVLDVLVDARLLTSYEDAGVGDAGASRQRLEIIHESLLSNWPRLVRWRTQDAEGAQLRDDLRQTAGRWHEKGRPDHLLWTGTSFKEFELWRERYPGGLTETEEAFAEAAVELAGRTRRRRRIALTAAFAVLVGGLITVAGFWKESESARQEAVEEARRAEASKLVALGQNVLEEDPSEALAHALASLELSDQEPARLLALEALWRSPTALQTGSGESSAGAFSADGSWLALGDQLGRLTLVTRDGRVGDAVRAHEGEVTRIEFVTRDVLASFAGDSKVSLWRVPGLEPIRTLAVDDALGFRAAPDAGGRPGVVTWEASGQVKWWSTASDEPRDLGAVAYQRGRTPYTSNWDVDPTGRFFVYGRGQSILREPLSELGGHRPELVGVAPVDVWSLTISPDGATVASTFDSPPGVGLWALEPPYGELPLREASEGMGTGGAAFSPDGRWLASPGIATNCYLWDLAGPPDAEPVRLRRRGTVLPRAAAFSPDGSWLLTVRTSSADLWPLERPFATVLRKHGEVWGVGAAPDGSWVAASGPQEARMWSTRRGSSPGGRELVGTDIWSLRTAVSPDGSRIAVGSTDGRLIVRGADLGAPRVVRPFVANGPVAVTFDPTGRVLASGGGFSDPADAFIHLWDLETDEQSRLDPGHGTLITRLAFMPDGRLVESSLDGLAIWDLSTGVRRELTSGETWDGQPGPEADSVVFLAGTGHFQGTAQRVDLESGAELPMADRGVLAGLTVTRAGELLGSTLEGTLQVEALAEGRPHLLFGHQGFVFSIAEGLDSIVSGGYDGTVRIWPKPDLGQTPFHLMRYEELLASLRALTNVRVVRDERSPTGYRTEIGEFPGWSVIPTW